MNSWNEDVMDVRSMLVNHIRDAKRRQMLDLNKELNEQTRAAVKAYLERLERLDT